jgi:hypothetical protein
MSKTLDRMGISGGIAIAISFFLMIQSFIAPLAQARAANMLALDTALSVICSADAGLDHGSGDQQQPDHCELPCCLPAQRADFQINFLTVEPVAIYVAPLRQLVYATPYSLWADLLPDDLISSRQNRARAPPKLS